jgi:hypothetical protein
VSYFPGTVEASENGVAFVFAYAGTSVSHAHDIFTVTVK